MSKKGKKGKISSESKTCFIFTAVFIGCGLLLYLFGKFLYHPAGMVPLDDIKTGQTATVISVDKVSRNLSQSDRKIEKDKGATEDELDYEYDVEYSITDDGTEYTFVEKEKYRSDSTGPEVGDTSVVNYAIVDGELIVHPETQENNQFTFCGGALMVLGVLAFGIGMFLKK